MRYSLEDNVTNAIMYEHKMIKGALTPVAVESICVSNTPEGRSKLVEWYNVRKAKIDSMRAYRDINGCCSTCTKCNLDCKPDYKETVNDLIVACTSYRSINEPKKRTLQG